MSPPLSGFPFDELFTLIRHFGIYHQKFAVVKAGDERYGYCGGIDINPNRLDDVRHLAHGPYHDVHARVEGRRCATSSCRSRSAGRATAAASRSRSSPRRRQRRGLGTPATDVVQVARTYFRAADPSRALAFAPHGDRTIADTMLAAIAPATRVHLHRGPVLHAAGGLPRRAAGEGRRAATSARSSSCCRRRPTSRSARSCARGFIAALHDGGRRHAASSASATRAATTRCPTTSLRASSGRCC